MEEVDCFVAEFIIGPAEGGTRWRLAMTLDGPGSMAGGDSQMKVIGLAGWSGAGKTTLLTRVIPHLLSHSLRVSVIKHAHHSFDVDVPGKDSWVHRQSGAAEVLVSSGLRWALMHELRGVPDPGCIGSPAPPKCWCPPAIGGP